MRTDQISLIARPYAAAAFAEALSEGRVSDWGAMLEAAAVMTDNHAVRTLLARPGMDPAQLSHFYCEVLAPMLNEEGIRFLELLANYRRLSALPEIFRQYEAKREIYENKVTVEVVSALPLEEPYLKKLTAALEKRFERKVILECSVDPALVGGVQVKVGDTMLDGSVRGKLLRMIEFISEK